MNRRTVLIIAGVALAVLLLGGGVAFRWFTSQINFASGRGEAAPTELTLPPGFTAEVFAEGLQTPRFLAFDPAGVLHVAEWGAGRVVALPDRDGDGRADGLEPLAEELDSPHSLVYRDDGWYVGVPSGVVYLADTTGDGRADEQRPIITDLPSDGSHRTRTVDFLPDGRMVVSVGSSCNVCEEEDPRRATILVYDDAAGNGGRILATGLRNAVGLDVNPTTGELWANNNGRDLMGDDEPPETLYRIHDGADYGWPRCHSGRIIDPDMGQPGDCDRVAPPIVEMQAHSAPLGMVFYDGSSFPADYAGDLFMAFHGSWNRSVPTGYKVVRIPFDGGEVSGPLEDFATGWLDETTYETSGRPVGLAVGPDGALYISDSKGGFVYRVTYSSAD
jgi:glucose/arabinose dehydrogenase